MLACVVTIVPENATASTDGDFRYSIDQSGNAMITGYIGSSDDIIIPGTVSNGSVSYPVSSIAATAFMGLENMTSVQIPEGIVSIGDYAFYGCISLGNITIPKNVTYLGSYCFYECTNLTSVIILGDIAAVRYAAFASCFQLAQIILPGTLRSIESYAFIYCASLKEIDIPEGVVSIGKNAFFNCQSLESLTIPNSVTMVDDYAFIRCLAITSLVLGNGIEVLGNGSFMECISLRDVTLPASLRTIEGSAFAHTDNLTGLTFLGDAPSCGVDWALGANASLTVTFIDGAQGFTDTTWQGLPSVRVNAPDAPGRPTATSDGVNVALSWGAPQRTGNASIMSYQIFYGIDGNQSNWSSYGSVGGSVTSATLSGLVPGNTYHFAVRATNLAGNSSYSEQLVFKVSAGGSGLDLAPLALIVSVVAAAFAGLFLWNRSKLRK